MEIVLSDRAIQALKDAPPNVRRAFQKQLRFLAANLQLPSLHAKKYDEAKDLWQARVNKAWRFYFTITNDTSKQTTTEPARVNCRGRNLTLEKPLQLDRLIFPHFGKTAP
jgi:mRNA-degrading endonuclease RelE of RelBE toxin-antitoxin system